MIINFDEEAYLEANPDVKEALEKGEFPSLEIYMKQFGLKRIEHGKTKFHKDLPVYDKSMYLEEFPEAQSLVNNGEYASVFDHFSKVGYTKLLEYLHQKNIILNMQEETSQDEERLIRGFDEKAYLEANPDVKEAIEKGGFPSVEIYLEQFGIKRIKNSASQFHKDFEVYSEDLYREIFPEVDTLLESKKVQSVFEHFCKEGYKKIISAEDVWPEYGSSDKKKGSIYHYIDNLVQVNDTALFISGWYYGNNDIGIEDISIIPDAGEIKIFNHPRGDLKKKVDSDWKKAGFYGIIKLDKPLLKNKKFGITFKAGEIKSYHTWEITSDLDAKELSTKMFLPIEIKGTFRNVFEEAFGPLLDTLWQKHYELHHVSPEEVHYGILPKEPELSIIVPLYGRIDFMEYQLALFANDSDFKEKTELIYVLDDPERFSETIDEVSKSLYSLMNVPFKVVTYDTNLGYARANNVGVSFATSDKILLLNSDVFPKENGWVTRMLEVYSELENPGTLGFKLLFEDDSIQHAGMVFERNPYLDNMWANIHPHKGMPDLEHEFVVKEVPAVTGACMLLEKENYLAVGGLSENYVLGDFEDSDLCLKLMEKGLKIYYSTEPSLYHLERQSQSLFDDQSWKFKITVFNCWQQTKQWNDTIEKTMEHFNA